jgi:hypothetical protein
VPALRGDEGRAHLVLLFKSNQPGRELPDHVSGIRLRDIATGPAAPPLCADLAPIHRLLKPGARFLSLDFLVGVEGFLTHGFQCFLAVSRGEWEQTLPAIGFDDIETQKVRDYLIVDARKTHGHPEQSYAPAKDAETAGGRKRDQKKRSENAALRV